MPKSKKLLKTSYKLPPYQYIIGIDEVGRGPLAGPVTVCALALPLAFNLKAVSYKLKAKLRDSKKLSPKQREEWVKWIKEQKIPYTICDISPKIIDKINITQAANSAASKALEKLLADNLQPTTYNKIRIYLDGGLKINNQKNLQTYRLKNLQTVIKGDEKIPAISLASIIAKVHRDKYMEKMHKKYPRYGFDEHKGYGTKKHIKAIKKFGPSEIHRRTFLKNFL